MPLNPASNHSTSAFVRRLRVRKEDSAHVYAILESHEGIASYSTLAHSPGDPHRDLELTVPSGFKAEVERVIRELNESGVITYDLDP